MSEEAREDEGVLVGTGAFLVDRAQALDKLMRFQLPEPLGFLLLWLRAASASGATYFAVDVSGAALSVEFDGHPLARRELEDPYRCLFERRTPETDRNRMLASGLLSALRLSPSSLVVQSGRDAERCALRLHSIEKEELVDAGPGDTSRVDMVFTSAAAAAKSAEFLRAGCALSTLNVTVDGERAAVWSDRPGAGGFQDAEARGWVAVPAEPQRDSTVALYAHGALIERLVHKLPVAQVDAWINDDAFVLNASQSGVVRDDVFKRAVAKLEEPTRRLALARAASLGQTMPATARSLLDPALRRRWKTVLEEGREKDPSGTVAAVLDNAAALINAVTSSASPAEAAAVEEEARAVRWLRRVAAARLRGKPKKEDPLDAALRAAPLFLAADGQPIGVSEMAAQGEKLAYLPCSYAELGGAALPFRPLWLLSDGEYELAGKLSGADPRDVTPVVERQKAAPRDRAATLEHAGLPRPLIRAEFGETGFSGEVGLSPLPEKTASLHLLTAGVPSGLVQDEGGILRFDAVAADPAGRWPDRVLSASDPACASLLEAARAKALGLYKKLTQELEPADRSARGAAIRAHLLDCLAWQLRQGGEAWAASEPLFDSSTGAMTYAQLSTSLSGGDAVYVARDFLEQAWSGRFVIAGAALDARLLPLLFPEHTLVPVRSGVTAVLRRPKPCGSLPGALCAFAFRAGREVYHAARTEKRAFSWNDASIHRADSPWEPALDPAGHPEIAAQLLGLAVRGSGPLHDQPADPRRMLILDLLAAAPPPWDGAAGEAIWNSVKRRPFFRSAAGGSRALEDVFAALNSSAGRLTYASDPAVPADLILDEQELRTARRLEPLGAGRLLPFGAPERARPVAGAPLADAEPMPSSFLSIFRGKSMIKPSERFFMERRFQNAGLDVWLGVPLRLPAPKPAFVPGGEGEFELGFLPPLASVLVDAAGWTAAGSRPAEPALMEMLRSLYSDLADLWPPARPGGPFFEVARRYVLEAAYLCEKEPDRFKGWQPVRRKLANLKLFELTDGSWSSLDELRDAIKADGALRFADPKAPPRAPEGGPAPLLAQPRLIAQLLGGAKTRRVKDSPPEIPDLAPRVLETAPREAAPPEEDEPRARTAAAGAEDLSLKAARAYPVESEPPPVVALAHRLLLGLRGRKGLRLPRHELSSLLLGRGLPLKPLTIDEDGAWILDASHPLVASVLNSPLSPEDQAAYLASVAYTAANRLKAQVTDADDIAFQEALSAALELS